MPRSGNHCPWNRCSFLCHPERSRGICGSTDPSWKCFSTERRDPRFYGPFVEMFFDGASASQSYCVQKGLSRGVEEPVLSLPKEPRRCTSCLECSVLFNRRGLRTSSFLHVRSISYEYCHFMHRSHLFKALRRCMLTNSTRQSTGKEQIHTQIERKMSAQSKISGRSLTVRSRCSCAA